jgi:hypothetical protein
MRHAKTGDGSFAIEEVQTALTAARKHPPVRHRAAGELSPMKAPKPSKLRDAAKAALRRRFAGTTDRRGYVREPHENLVVGVSMENFEDDLRNGDGDELRMKFCALHSSAALAVNTFAPFKMRPAALVLGGRSGFTSLSFERRLRTVGMAKANLDVWLESETGVIAIESKFLEYCEPKKAEFSASYNRAALTEVDECWWEAFDAAKLATARHLDVAQLIKHYFALSRLRSTQAPGHYTLLYLFWEPENAEEFEACRQHRSQLEAFAAGVCSSTVTFQSMTYSQLWQEWAAIPALAGHAHNLKARYELRL